MNWDFPYTSQRMPVLADNVVATSQPLAAQAGIRMLLRGGNAVDAAIAAAVTLTVVEPVSNGLGSDAFAQVWDGTRLHGFNGSGRSPAAWTPERYRGLDAIPPLGWDAVTIPGCVDLWARLSERFGRLPFADLFGPAVHYARHGFQVSPIIAAAWAGALDRYREFPSFGETFLPGGRAPRPGETFRCPDQADSLEKIAETRGETFYRGDLADRIADFARKTGGVLTAADLGSHQGEWVTPVSRTFRDVTLHEIPPNGQGIAALMALGILDHFDLSRFAPDSPDTIHLQIEAMRLAFSEAHRHVADPAWMTLAPTELLSPDRLGSLAGRIRMDRTLDTAGAPPADHGTVYLTAADADGMMVSLIQSNFMGFGSGVVVPGTGISFQNRGAGFVLQPGHPNCVAGGKRPYHTIIPGFVTGPDGTGLMSFGVMGGHMQPQGHVQMMARIFASGQNPQAAADAPRWYVHTDQEVALEAGASDSLRKELARRGHRLMKETPFWGFGGAQLILKTGGGYCAGSDFRKDGQAVGF